MIELDKRKQLILAAIVEEYITSGEPVGSRAVVDKLNMPVSSATIRNEMAALTEMNLIEQPHTSAGRIPSYLGYRYYIDRLMNKKPLTKQERHSIDEVFLTGETDVDQLLEATSNALALLTGLASVSTTPMAQSCVFCRIELVRGGRRVVILLFMTNTGRVRNRMCRLDAEPDAEDLEAFVRAVNDELADTPVEDVTLAFIQTLGAKMGGDSLLFSPVLFAVYTLASEVSGGQLILEGQANLLAHKELAQNAKTIMEFLSREDVLKKTLEQNSGGLSVIMGSEMQYSAAPQIGLVVSKYRIGGQPAGSIGIIGPARIDYSKIIPYIEYFAQSMGKLLTEYLQDEE